MPKNHHIRNWRAVPDWEGIYEVSDWGEVRRIKPYKGKQVLIMKPTNRSNGYLAVNLVDGKRRKMTSIHRIVLAAFIGRPKQGQVTRHLDGNPSNNKIDNLVWGTQIENWADRVRHGRHCRGEYCTTAKLKLSQVREIRRLKGKLCYHDIAKIYGVSKPCITAIMTGRNWKHDH